MNSFYKKIITFRNFAGVRRGGGGGGEIPVGF